MKDKDTILLENLYSEMAYPVSFSFDEFNKITSYSGKLKYANERLQKLASGSSRVVYKVDEEKVLKIAKNKKGLAQNSTESDYSLQNYYKDTVARVFETSDDNYWVEMELAKKVSPKRFQELVGVSLKDIQDILVALRDANRPSAYQNREQVRIKEQEALQKVENNDFLSSLWDMIMNYDMSYPADFGRVSTYGEVIREGKSEIVIIDFGLTRSTFEDFYKVN